MTVEKIAASADMKIKSFSLRLGVEQERRASLQVEELPLVKEEVNRP